MEVGTLCTLRRWKRVAVEGREERRLYSERTGVEEASS